MKNKFKILPLILILGFAACRKPVEVPNPFYSEEDVRKDLLDELRPQPEVFHRKGEYFAEPVRTRDGIKISLPWIGILKENGTLYPNGYDIKVISMLTMKNMFLNNVSTVGPGGLFQSGGQISIRAFESSGNSEIPYFPKFGIIGVNFPGVSASVGMLPEFPIWYGSVNQSSGAVNWVPADSTVIDTFTLRPTGFVSYPNYYSNRDSIRQSFNLIKFGYVNLDFYYPSNASKARIVVQVPEKVSDKNSICGIAFPELNSVATQFDFDSTKNQFVLSNDIPVGLSAKIILISKHSSKYYSIIKPVIVQQNAIISATPVETTVADFKQALNGL